MVRNELTTHKMIAGAHIDGAFKHGADNDERNLHCSAEHTHLSIQMHWFKRVNAQLLGNRCNR